MCSRYPSGGLHDVILLTVTSAVIDADVHPARCHLSGRSARPPAHARGAVTPAAMTGRVVKTIRPARPGSNDAAFVLLVRDASAAIKSASMCVSSTPDWCSGLAPFSSSTSASSRCSVPTELWPSRGASWKVSSRTLRRCAARWD